MKDLLIKVIAAGKYKIVSLFTENKHYNNPVGCVDLQSIFDEMIRQVNMTPIPRQFTLRKDEIIPFIIQKQHRINELAKYTDKTSPNTQQWFTNVIGIHMLYGEIIELLEYYKTLDNEQV